MAKWSLVKNKGLQSLNATLCYSLYDPCKFQAWHFKNTQYRQPFLKRSLSLIWCLLLLLAHDRWRRQGVMSEERRDVTQHGVLIDWLLERSTGCTTNHFWMMPRRGPEIDPCLLGSPLCCWTWGVINDVYTNMHINYSHTHKLPLSLIQKVRTNSHKQAEIMWVHWCIFMSCFKLFCPPMFHASTTGLHIHMKHEYWRTEKIFTTIPMFHNTDEGLFSLNICFPPYSGVLGKILAPNLDLSVGGLTVATKDSTKHKISLKNVAPVIYSVYASPVS